MDIFEIMISMIKHILYVIIIMLIYGIKIIRKMPIFLTAASMAPAAMAATGSRVEEARRMSSIEWEPKTLTVDQIKFARVSRTYID
jgi:hypothetical protein